MKYRLLVLCALLAGCATPVPVTRTFPEAPPELVKRCEDLKKVESTAPVAITELLKVVVNNYALYHECSLKVDGWNEWYKAQRKIFNEVK